MTRTIKAVLWLCAAVLTGVVGLIISYADEYLRPYKKHEMRKP